MPSREASRPADPRLIGYVLLGLGLGVAFVVFDVLSESRIEAGTLTGALAHAHAAIDHTFPILVGGLLGVSLHYLRVRRQLVTAQDAARRADALRDRLHKVERDQAVWVLAATVLHELVNPLHALGLLVDELADAPDASQLKDLTLRARAQIDRSEGQLELLRAMRGNAEPDLVRVSLGRLVRALAVDVRTLSLAKDGSASSATTVTVTVTGHDDVLVRADETYVRTILENLVDNSLHSLEGQERGGITLLLGTTEGRGIVEIRDDGPSFAPSITDLLFEPLRSTRPDGLGLGLPIARALARAMRGELSLGDAGAKSFRLELPLADAAPSRSAP